MNRTWLYGLTGAMLVLIVAHGFVMTNALTPPVSRTGAPGETTCADCHGNLNTGPGDVILTLDTPYYISGETHTVTVQVIDGTKLRFGFETTALDSNNAKAGDFIITNVTNTALQTNIGRQYASHKSASGSNIWQFNWMTPVSDAGPVTFWIAGNAANNDFSSLGDNIYTRSYTFKKVLEVTATGTNVSCNGLCDGTATANPSGGCPPYTYQWNDPAFQTTQSISALCPSTYIVIVTDTCGNTAPDTVIITEPLALSINFTNIVPDTCNSSTGGACASVSGGTPPYTYIWNDPPVTTDSCFSGGPAGDYIVTVTDANGCQGTDTVAIAFGVQFPSTPGTITGPGTPCVGTSQTYCISTVSGATSYTWTVPSGWTINSGQGTTCITVTVGSNSGNVCVRACNTCGCSAFQCMLVSPQTTPAAPGPISGPATLNPNDTVIYSISVVGTNSYLWTVPSGWTIISGQGTTAITATAMDSTGGNVCVRACNGCGCSSFTCIVVSFCNFTISLSGNDLTCNGLCDGSATVSVTGTTPPYTYSWSNGDSDTLADSLCAGTYDVTVTDSSGCVATGSVTISAPQPLVIDSIVKTNVSCFGSCDGTANVYVSGGIPPYAYVWNLPPPCPDTSFTLYAGTYTVSVTDVNGCTVTDSVTITEPPVLSITFTNIVPDSCNDSTGGVCASVSGGTSSYTYLWNDLAATTDSCLPGVQGGDYIILVTDANECSINDIVTIPSVSPLTLVIDSIVTTDVSCFGSCDGTANVYVSGGTPPYTYLWSPSCPFPLPCNMLCADSYSVIVADSNGCLVTDSAFITEPPLIQISVSAAICDNDSIFLGGAYQNTTGTYYDTLMAVNGCDSIIETALIVNTLPDIDLGPDTSLCNSCSITLDAGAGFDNYLWSTGDTTQAITIDSAGTYTVEVTGSNGCKGSDTVMISILSGIINDINDENILNIYPNPATDNITITGKLFTPSWILSAAEIMLTLYDYTGRVAMATPLNISKGGKLSETVSIEELRPGLYLYRINSCSGILCRGKLVVQ